MNSTIQQLKQLKNISPSQEWLKDNKAQLMSRFFTDQPSSDPGLHPHWEMLLLKTAGVFVLVIFAIAGTLGIVSAAQNSLPGDLMYPLKIVVEKAQAKFVASEGAKADLKTEFASRRMREFRQLIDKPEVSAKQDQKIAQAVGNFQKEINDVNQLLNKTKDNESAVKAVAVAKQLNLEVVKYENTLTQANKTLSEPLQKDVQEAIDSVEKTKMASLKVIIEKSDPEQDPALTQAVTSQVAAKIEKTETQLAQVIKQGVEKISQAAEDQKEPMAVSESGSLAKTEQASAILTQAKQDFAELNLLAALDKAENSRRLIEEAVELMAQSESTATSNTIPKETEQAGSSSPEDNLTTPSTLDAGESDNQEQTPEDLLNILQIQ